LLKYYFRYASGKLGIIFLTWFIVKVLSIGTRNFNPKKKLSTKYFWQFCRIFKFGSFVCLSTNIKNSGDSGVGKQYLIFCFILSSGGAILRQTGVARSQFCFFKGLKYFEILKIDI
jgi:hypothetical protein